MANVLRAAVVVAALALSSAAAQNPGNYPHTDWDGLVQVNSSRFDTVYMLPGADFSGFTKVMLDPTEVAFRRNWQRNINSSTRSVSGRITDRDAERILEQVRTGFQDVFAEEFARGGYQLVTTPGPDVLRLRTAVTNIDIAAPDRRSSARNRTYSRTAGQATLVIEARESMSGAVLGRAVDRRIADSGAFTARRNRTTNTWDFERMFRAWGRMSASALDGLRATPAPAEEPATGQP